MEPLRKIEAEGPRRKITGLQVEGKRIARQGAQVLSGGKEAGVVTSGTMSPTIGMSIAMAFVEADKSVEGAELEVDVRGSTAAAKVVPLPFYKRSK